MIERHGGDDTIHTQAELREWFTYRDFPHFMETWVWMNGFLRRYDDFTFAAEVTAQDLAAQNIRYAEMFFSPSLFVRHGLEVQRLAEAVRGADQEETGSDDLPNRERVAA